jgi:hypothetical protein
MEGDSAEVRVVVRFDSAIRRGHLEGPMLSKAQHIIHFEYITHSVSTSILIP